MNLITLLHLHPLNNPTLRPQYSLSIFPARVLWPLVHRCFSVVNSIRGLIFYLPGLRHL